MNAHAYPLRILIVDANPHACDDLRRLVRPLLSRDSVLVACPRAHDALTLAEMVDFDVVLCDIDLPEMDGIGFTAALERTAPALAERTILMTDGPRSERTRAFLAHRRRRVIEKPTTRDELFSALGRLAAEPIRVAS